MPTPTACATSTTGTIMSGQTPPPPPPPPPSPPPGQPPASPPPEGFPQAGGATVGTSSKPWWKRWWGILLILFGLLVVIGVVAGLGEEVDDTEDVAADSEPADVSEPDEAEPAEPADSEPAEDTPTDEAPPVEEPAEAEPDTEIEEPEPDPEPEPTFETATFEGSGDDVIDVPDTEDYALVATITHTGERNFAVTSFDPDGSYVDLLVNHIGSYTGTVPYNFDSAIGELEITADGAWTITIADLAEQPLLADTASGSGDEVLRHDGSSGRLHITHDGERNFAVIGWGQDWQLLVNEIGSYEGTVRLESAVAFEITADGAWTIELQ